MPAELNPREYELVRELAAKGNSLRTIAKETGIRWGTFLQRRKDDERLEEAIRIGRGQEHDALHGRLYGIATQGKGKEAVTACIFLLKCRHGYRERGESQLATSQVAVQITLPGAMTADQYEKLSAGCATGPTGKAKTAGHTREPE